jgi:hypothetical protein
LPNKYNLYYLYDNLNQSQRQKCFTFRNTRWGEIWFCFPSGTSTECNAAVIYNKRENYWYDTLFPTDPRSCATPPSVYAYPIMGDPVADVNSKYIIYQHETGTDEVNFNSTLAINSYYQTSLFDLASLPQNPSNKHISIDVVEPDFRQKMDMQAQIFGRANARGSLVYSAAQPIVDPVAITDPHQQIANFKTKFRQIGLKFSSNTPGGDFQAGRTRVHIRQDDETTIVR